MNFLEKIKDSPHYPKLKGSLQYRYDRRQFLFMSVFFGIVGLVLWLPLLVGSAKPNPTFVIYLLLWMFLLFGWLYFAYQLLEIFLHMDKYIFCQVRLDQPYLQHHRYGSSVGFTVEFTDRYGKTLKRKTSAMFSSQTEPCLEEYNNQTVLIGYNQETDRLVVIQRV